MFLVEVRFLLPHDEGKIKALGCLYRCCVTYKTIKNLIIMKYFILTLGLIMLSIISFGQTANLTLIVTNIEEVKGNMSIAIFNNSEGFPDGDTYFIGKIIPVKSKKFEYVFNNIPIGKYAIAIYQDINKNGKLDTNWFGIPREPYGFSYIEKGKTGSAEFDEATIEIKDNIVINISLIN